MEYDLQKLKRDADMTDGMTRTDLLRHLVGIYKGLQEIERQAAKDPFNFPLQDLKTLQALAPKLKVKIIRLKWSLNQERMAMRRRY